MRILILNDDLGGGGVQRYVVDLATLLEGAGHQVTVMAADGVLRRHMTPRVRVVAAHPVRAPMTLARLLQAADLVLPQQRGVALAVHLLRRVVLRRPRVVEFVHNEFSDRKLLSFRSRELVAVGPSVARALIEEYRRPRERIRVVENGVADVGQLVAGRPSSHLVWAGRLHEQKDPLLFVSVVAELRRLGLPVTATMVGDGPMHSAVEDAIATASVGSSIALVPWTFTWQEWLEDAAAYVSTSRWEGLPQLALEALAAGRPVCLRDVGSCGVIATRSEGVLVPRTATAGEYAAALSPLLADVQDWPRRCRAARNSYERYFNRERWARDVLDVVEASV